jgi:uncharacterized protein YaeQ
VQIRCNIYLNDVSKKLVLVSLDNETPETVALRLAAYLLFFRFNPIMDPSSKHPMLLGQEFRPDMMCLDEAGQIAIWIECGTVATYKCDKLIRRNRNGRVVVFKHSLREAQNLRHAFEKNDIANSERVEIYTFPPGEFEPWMNNLSESMEIVGEAHDKTFNLVANSGVFNFDFVLA